jgi:hypothetical protein
VTVTKPNIALDRKALPKDDSANEINIGAAVRSENCEEANPLPAIVHPTIG